MQRNEKEIFQEDNNIKTFRNKSRDRTLIGINAVGFILSIMAGWIDTIGLELFLDGSSAFMTGRAKALGYYAFKLDLKLLSKVILVIMAFIMGSFISTIVTTRAGLKGGLILTGMLVIISSLPVLSKYIIMIFLPMAMGCQNAATSLTPINRTTHLTGPMTDFGISIAKRSLGKIKFWSWRLLGFPLGSLIGFNLVRIVENNAVNASIILIIPAVIIMLTGIIQERIFSIPLLD